MNRFYAAVLCSVAICTSIQAQTTRLKGVVQASDGEPLPGVTVRVKGSKTGTITGADGTFSLSADKNATLIFSSIGYNSQTVTTDGRNFLTVQLKDNATDLDEVVISVPYGTAKKSSFTGSAINVDSKVIANSQVASVSRALEGTVAGVQSFSASGQPGEDADIYIRGIGSVNASTAPLYVVDGVPYDGKLASIATQDIASVTVLKDAAAASLYGSRAANGVIMITTKQGAKGSAPVIELSAKYGFSSRAVADYKQIGTNDYFKLQWEALRNQYADQLDDQGKHAYDAATAAKLASEGLVKSLGINPYGSKYPQPVDTNGNLEPGAYPLWNDSWEDAVTQNAHYTDLNASISGGSANSNYYISLGYLDNQGAYIESGFKRYTFRTNITSRLTRWLQAGLNLSGAYSLQKYPKQDDTELHNVVLFARNLPSFYPVYERDPDTGAYKLDKNGDRIYDYGYYRAGSYSGWNLAQSMRYNKNDIRRDAASVRGFLEFAPIEGLTYKTSINIDYNSRFEHDYTNPTYGKDAASGGWVSKSNVRSTGMTFNNVINYNHVFNDLHSLRLMAGQEYYEYNTSQFGGDRSGVITDGYYEPDVASTLKSFYGNSDQYKLLSYFGSAEYAYAQKYFASVSVRTDGSSRFSPEHRWGTFWSFGGSWKISKEKFLQKATASWLTNLTLRASYGAQGNDNVGYYAYQALYSIGQFLGESTLTPSRLGTPDLTWETNLNTNIGLDFGLWNNRLTGTIEFFNRASKDLLFSRELIASSGFSSTSANIGKLKNYGWEFTVTGVPVLTRDWKWSISLNATTYKNKIVSLPSDIMWSGWNKWVKGGSLYDMYLYEWAGINSEDGKPQWYYYDKEDGSKKVTEDYSSLTSDDRKKVGTSLPSVSGGFQTDLSWKGISLSALFSYAIGGKVYNSDYVSMMGAGGLNGNTFSVEMLNRWTPEHTNTDIPRLVNNQTSYFTASSTRWLINRSYLRLKTLTLSYNLPKNWLHAILFRDASIFIQGENLLTTSHKQGMDPEQPLSGYVGYRYPAMKTFSFGINIKI